jgi:hypothetical protein
MKTLSQLKHENWVRLQTTKQTYKRKIKYFLSEKRLCIEKANFSHSWPWELKMARFIRIFNL